MAENRAIREMLAVPGEQKAYRIRRGIRDVFRIPFGVFRNQAAYHQALVQSLRAVGEANRIDAFECRQSFAGCVFPAATTFG